MQYHPAPSARLAFVFSVIPRRSHACGVAAAWDDALKIKMGGAARVLAVNIGNTFLGFLIRVLLR
jgi:hypothetical protein